MKPSSLWVLSMQASILPAQLHPPGVLSVVITLSVMDSSLLFGVEYVLCNPSPASASDRAAPALVTNKRLL